MRLPTLAVRAATLAAALVAGIAWGTRSLGEATRAAAPAPSETAAHAPTDDAAASTRRLEAAARGGSAQAMFLLANAYRAGAGVTPSNAKALELYARAGELEHAGALQALAMAYHYGELGLAPDDAESRRYAMEAEHAVLHPPPM